MNMLKKVSASLLALTAALSISVSAFAATPRTHAEILADLTGRTVTEVTDERAATGKTYGALADSYGVLDEFRTACGHDWCDGTGYATGGHHGGGHRGGHHGGSYR